MDTQKWKASWNDSPMDLGQPTWIVAQDADGRMRMLPLTRLEEAILHAALSEACASAAYLRRVIESHSARTTPPAPVIASVAEGLRRFMSGGIEPENSNEQVRAFRARERARLREPAPAEDADPWMVEAERRLAEVKE